MRTLGGLMVLLCSAVAAAPAPAAFTSNSFENSYTTMTGDAASDTVTIGVLGGLLFHDRMADGGFNSQFDWDTGELGDQTLGQSAMLVLQTGAGDDRIALGGLANSTGGAHLVVLGGTGTDTLDYSAATGPVTVALGHTGRLYRTVMTGQNVLPAVVTTERASSVFVRTGTTVRSATAGTVTVATAHSLRSGIAGVNGPQITAVTPTPPNTASYTVDNDAVTLTSGQVDDLDANAVYEVISTVGSPTGEVRDQLGFLGLVGTATATFAAGASAVTGGPGADLLSGGDEANRLTGGAGVDSFAAGGGDDRIDARDSIAESVDCGTGEDVAVTDASDTTTGCETVAVPAVEPQPTPTATPTLAPTATATPSPTPVAALPAVSAMKLSPSRFRAARSGPSIVERGGATVSYRLSQAARVTFTVTQLRSGGKTKRIIGSISRTDFAGKVRFRFSGRVANRRLAAGRYRLTATPKDAAGRTGPTATATFTIR